MPVRLAEQFGVSPMTVQNVPTLRLERPIKALTRNSSILLPGALVWSGCRSATVLQIQHQN